MAEKQGLSRTAKIILAFVALGATCIPCVGVSAAIALPAFTRYTLRARVTEARANLASLRAGIDALGAMPAALPPTPDLTTLGSHARAWPTSPDPAWAQLGFPPSPTMYYAYSVTPNAALGTVRIEAVGDLDDDGFRSSFSQVGHFDPALSQFTWDEVIVLDELE